MNFLVRSLDIFKHSTQCAVVFVAGKKIEGSAKLINDKHHGIISKIIQIGDLKLTAGDAKWVTVDSKNSYERILVVQIGKHVARKPTQWSDVLNKLSTMLAAKDIKDATVYFDNLSADEADIAGYQLATLIGKQIYRYTETKSDSKPSVFKKLNVSAEGAANLRILRTSVQYGIAVAKGVNLARELGNLPGNICTPTYLADQAKALAKNSPLVKARVLTEKQMERLGMHSLLSVSNGSEQEAKLIILEYNGNPTVNSKPHVLVGKGITFDTGGISLKPGAAMDEMKFDMCGAASVLGTMQTIISLEPKKHIIGIVAAAENMPSGRATKPGDVVTSMSGQTIEILNTDAEGRLVLCDALTYAERYQPKSVIDIATLTGACVIALGSHASGLYSNDQNLADALLEAGRKADDKAWQMPLWDEYQKQLDSNFADMANIGGREAGSVTAACFLSRFTKKYRWAHLDIAGTAWNSGAKKGATGRPVALLVNYLMNH